MTLTAAPLSRTDLHAALAHAPAGATAVVCASARLAQQLGEEYARHQGAAGVLAWETPQILGLDAFLQAQHEAAAFDLQRAGQALPPLLSAHAERLLWRLVVAQSSGELPLLREAEAARLAQEAWQLVQEYALPFPLPATSPEVERFNDWAQQYRRRLQAHGGLDRSGWQAALLEAIAARRLPVPPTLVLAGFDEATPRVARCIAALQAAGSRLQWLAPTRAATVPRRVHAADAERELRAAAGWARQQALADGTVRIAVVVPDLRAQRESVQRLFDEQLCPQLEAPESHSPVRPYNLSLGVPLAATALVQTALRLLRLVQSGLPFGEASALLCAPGWGSGGEAERLERAALDAWLRREGYMDATLDTLRAQARAGSAVAATLQAIAAQRPGSRKALPGEWVETITAVLRAAGWPGPRALDSEEFQLHQRWRECLIELGRLDAILGRVGFAAALAQLGEIAAETVFQAQSPSARIQVLGALEAAGLEFDALWVCGLDDEHWPPPSRPHPFLPFALQRERGLPHASAVQELAYAQRMTARWCAAATEVVLSWPRQDQDRPLAPSPLLGAAAGSAEALEAPPLPASWCASQAASVLESFSDPQAPPPDLGAVQPGGARLLGDQARCPFRGFATHRLGARALEIPEPGLSAADRGNLVHRILEGLWRQLRDHAGLLALDDRALASGIGAAVDRELQRLAEDAPQRLRAGFRSLEEQRLRTLIRAWLEQEKARLPFRVIEIEGGAVEGVDAAADAPPVPFEGLQLRLRRDRVDTLDGGGRLLIDYKTGARGKPPWTDARPEEPQLLIYALSGGPVLALAYGRVVAGAPGFEGIAAAGDLVDGIRAYDALRDTRDAASWEALFGRWRGELATIAAEVREGWAAVTPKHPRQTCRDCDLHALCRIRESVAEVADAAEDGELEA